MRGRERGKRAVISLREFMISTSHSESTGGIPRASLGSRVEDVPRTMAPRAR